MSKALSMCERKALGAFYTDEPIASFLVRWALRKPGRAVMDPSCGDGRFLALAAEAGATRLVACDISPEAIRDTRRRLAGVTSRVEAVASDFFALEPAALPAVDAVVGNPPFIRYQRFRGESRRQALQSALRLGIRLTQLTSSWAPFLLHAIQFLSHGGDLAMVVPAEILRTHYGLATLRALLANFSAVTLYTFEENLFADAQEETCLLLAEGLGSACTEVRLVPLRSVGDLGAGLESGHQLSLGVLIPVAKEALVRFAEAFLDPAERRAWQRVRQHPAVRTVASLATVTNGYVTGDNDFFHKRFEDAVAEGYPQTWLFPVARSSRSLAGLAFTRQDVRDHEERGFAHHLLVPQEDLFATDSTALARFQAQGEGRGTPRRYKCQVRDPWWRVPGLAQADILVSYMAGAWPRAVVNRAAASYSNSLHGLRLRDNVQAELVALTFFSSLTLLSLEIEGRSYGGGILKLEPRELDRVLLACPEAPPRGLHDTVAAVDRLLRDGLNEEAVIQVDRILLEEALGLPKATVRHLQRARRHLVGRRMGRARRSSAGSGERAVATEGSYTGSA